MAGLMSRASTVVKAKFSKLLDRAEDPGETLDYSYEKQLQLLQNVKRGIADVVTARKRIELQQQQLEASVVKLETQARASAIEELTAAGALDDFTSSSDALDRELQQLSAGTQVDDELSRLKAELGTGDKPKELEQ